MSDEPTVDETPAPDPDMPPPAAAVEDEPLGDGGKKALDAERRSRRAAEKQLNELASKIREYEDRDKSEAERLAARLAEAEQEALAARSEALRLRVAADVGVSAELLEFITGTDEDTVRAQAEKLMAATAAKPASVPKPDPTQGAKPGGTPGQLTRADMAGMKPEEINKALLEGRFADLLSGRT